MSKQIHRRQALVATGTALSVAVAGCSSSDDTAGDDDDRQELRPEDWDGVDEIRLDGRINGWFGIDPDLIAGIRNPGILLFEGASYEITWENGDGSPHNIAIRDDGRSVVGGHRTSTMRDRGESQTIQFEATAEMHEYVCEPHPSSMIGYFHVIDS